jgi:hypothetical protein
MGEFPTSGPLDDFDRADGPVGANWTSPFRVSSESELAVASNELVCSNAVSSDGVWGTAFAEDQELYFSLPNYDIGRLMYMYARVSGTTDAMTGYLAGPQLGASVWKVFKVVAGVATQLGANLQASVPASGEKMGLVVRGTAPTVVTCYLFRGDVWNEFDARYDEVDAITGSGWIGLEVQRNSRVDDFGGGDSTTDLHPIGSFEWPDAGSISGGGSGGEGGE